MTEKLCILVDGSSYLYRAYHAMPYLTNDAGDPTGALYGVINMLKSLQKTYPDAAYFAVVFDPKGPTSRHTVYPQYKANRAAMPDELACQIAPLHAVIRALGIPLIMVPGEEADDVIGTIAHQACQADYDVLISTGDKDMAQLVNPSVTLINTMNDQRLDREGVKAKFGVYPEQIIDYLALIGDTSDNIPGVDKVGPKTAAKWLEAYGDIETLCANQDALRGKVAENLANSQQTLRLAKQLVTINQHVPMPHFTLADCALQPADNPALAELYKTWGFKKFLQDLGPEVVPTPTVPTHYHTITSQAEWAALLETLSGYDTIAVDTETQSLNAREATLVGISLAVEAHTAYYIPCGHNYPGCPAQLPLTQVIDGLKPILSAKTVQIVGQNIKYDYQVLRRYGLILGGTWIDTMLLSYVLNSGAGRHNLTALAGRFLDTSVMEFEAVVGRGKAQKTFNEVPLAEATQYAAEDADIALRLYQHIWPQLVEANLVEVYHQLDAPLIAILADMEQNGILLDSAQLAQQGKRLARTIEELVQRIHDLAGESFNIASTKQLRTILFEKLQLPVLKKTPSKQPATSEEVLLALSESHEIAEVLLSYRRLTKLQSTYVEKLPQEVDRATGRIHSSFNQAVTVTGRLSSTDPNLQNIPVKTPEGRLIRQAFIAPPGHVLLAADYSQIELRIMAHLSGDPALLLAFSAGCDIHTATAAEVFGVEESAVSVTQRRHAKAINFGLIYGMSAFGLAKQIGVSRPEAQAYIDTYFARYPGVKQYMEAAVNTGAEQGYVSTIFGRRLYLPGIKDKNAMVRKAAERAAINAPMQGSAADLMKLAMQRVTRDLAQAQIPARLCLQVHDELVFEVPEADIERLSHVVREAMEGAASLQVPLTVSIGYGANWDDAH
jgi:DNA polymerase-1